MTPPAPEKPVFNTIRADAPSPPLLEDVAQAQSRLNTGLSGTWRLSAVDEDTGEEHELGRVCLVDNDGELRVEPSEYLPNSSISFDGRRLTLSSSDNRTTNLFEGSLNTQKTEARGVYTWKYLGEEVSVSTSTAVFTLLSEDFLLDEQRTNKLRQARLDEAESIYETIHNFAERNSGMYPSALSQIPISSFQDPASMANVPGRTITYFGSVTVLDSARLREIFDQFRDIELSTQMLLERERQLREIWGGDTPAASPLFRIQYAEPALTIEYSATGVMALREPGASVQSDPEELRRQEFNNLKQLVLICKMFQAEQNEHLPPGWITVYPEYLSDPNILRSPWSEESTSSYHLLQPGAREEDLFALGEELAATGAVDTAGQASGSDAWRSQLASNIPIIVGTDTLPVVDDPAPTRAVAFLDGHVEAVRVDDWERRITPFQR